MVADNRLAENSIWDDRLLAEQLKSLSEVELDFSLDVTGFEVGEIDVIIEGMEPAVACENDPADALPESEYAIRCQRAGRSLALGTPPDLLWQLAEWQYLLGADGWSSR
jgi:hypothetical protein